MTKKAQTHLSIGQVSQFYSATCLTFTPPFRRVDFRAQYDLWKWLLTNLGPEVNIGNVPHEQAVRLACLRPGVGSDSTLEKGAFILSQNGLLK